MTVHYCDRCKRPAQKLTYHKIPDDEKCHSATSYGVKEVELCNTCVAFVRRSEEKFLNAIIKTKFAFYKAIMTVDSESDQKEDINE